jgi:hypothetical protein
MQRALVETRWERFADNDPLAKTRGSFLGTLASQRATLSALVETHGKSFADNDPLATTRGSFLGTLASQRATLTALVETHGKRLAGDEACAETLWPFVATLRSFVAARSPCVETHLKRCVDGTTGGEVRRDDRGIGRWPRAWRAVATAVGVGRHDRVLIVVAGHDPGAVLAGDLRTDEAQA